jgi:4-aminobutyrate aminotransferase
VVRFIPALVVNEQQVDDAAEIFSDAVASVLG